MQLPRPWLHPTKRKPRNSSWEATWSLLGVKSPDRRFKRYLKWQLNPKCSSMGFTFWSYIKGKLDVVTSSSESTFIIRTSLVLKSFVLVSATAPRPSTAPSTRGCCDRPDPELSFAERWWQLGRYSISLIQLEITPDLSHVYPPCFKRTYWKLVL